jgi:hypothetical protein
MRWVKRVIEKVTDNLDVSFTVPTPLGGGVNLGKKQPPIIHTVVVEAETQWEYCEIEWKYIDGNALTALVGQFEAHVLEDQRLVAQSKVVRGQGGPQRDYGPHQAAFLGLVGRSRRWGGR